MVPRSREVLEPVHAPVSIGHKVVSCSTKGVSMNIYVGNLSFKTTERELQEAFAPFGEVGSVRIITDGYTGKSKGFGFVEMPNAAEAKAAMEGLNGKELGGSVLRVNEAKPREDRRGGGRREGGHFGGRGRGGGGGGGGRRF